jgi:hypothetical protein
MENKLEAVQMSVKGVESSLEGVKNSLEQEREERLERQGQVREEMMDLQKKLDAKSEEIERKFEEKWEKEREDHRERERKKMPTENEGDDWTEVGAKGRPKGKGKGKQEEKNEEMSRTVVFGGYTSGSAAADIIEHLNKIAEEASVEKEIEDTFAFGRKWANGGGLRFKTKKQMWDYMKERRGAHIHEYKGARIYGRVGFVEDENTERSKSMRKAVRAVIETEKGEAADTKDNITARYWKGELVYKGEMVAVWKTGQTMEWRGLPEAAKRYEELLEKAAA